MAQRRGGQRKAEEVWLPASQVEQAKLRTSLMARAIAAMAAAPATSTGGFRRHRRVPQAAGSDLRVWARREVSALVRDLGTDNYAKPRRPRAFEVADEFARHRKLHADVEPGPCPVSEQQDAAADCSSKRAVLKAHVRFIRAYVALERERGRPQLLVLDVDVLARPEEPRWRAYQLLQKLGLEPRQIALLSLLPRANARPITEAQIKHEVHRLATTKWDAKKRARRSAAPDSDP